MDIETEHPCMKLRIARPESVFKNIVENSRINAANISLSLNQGLHLVTEPVPGAPVIIIPVGDESTLTLFNCQIAGAADR